ncbi:MAG: type IV secretory system conjugative DNA transfer family protein [Clostridium sp.]
MFGELALLIQLIGGLAVGGELLCLLSKDKEGKIATGEFKGPDELKGLTGDDGIRLSKQIQLNKAKTREHALCLGATGEGKTTSLFYPNLLANDITGSIIVLDPKGELYRDTSEYQKSIGRDVVVFSPLNPLNTKYNLLKECRNTTEVIELAQTILLNSTKSLELQTSTKAGGIEWINMSLPLFISALLYCRHKGGYMCSITNAARLIISNTTEDLQLILGECINDEVKEQFSIFESCLESPKTASSIKITLNTSLQLFLDENIVRTTSATQFNAKSLRKKPTCLYISYPEHKSNYVSPLMATFFTQLINHLMDTKGEPVTIMADEFANIGMINNFSNIISTCRSREIAFLICLQSTSQLTQVYGRDNAKSILNNLKTKCVLPSTSDIDTLNYISDLLGETEITTINNTKSTSNNNRSCTESISKSKKRLLAADEIRRLASGKMLILCHNRQPVIDEQNVYYVNKEYTNRIKKAL